MFRVHIVFVTKESIRIGIAAFFMVEFSHSTHSVNAGACASSRTTNLSYVLRPLHFRLLSQPVLEIELEGRTQLVGILLRIQRWPDP